MEIRPGRVVAPRMPACRGKWEAWRSLGRSVSRSVVQSGQSVGWLDSNVIDCAKLDSAVNASHTLHTSPSVALCLHCNPATQRALSACVPAWLPGCLAALLLACVRACSACVRAQAGEAHAFPSFLSTLTRPSLTHHARLRAQKASPTVTLSNHTRKHSATLTFHPHRHRHRHRHRRHSPPSFAPSSLSTPSPSSQPCQISLLLPSPSSPSSCIRLSIVTLVSLVLFQKTKIY